MNNVPGLPDGPYKGLVPYAEEDAPFFFGRDVDRELVIANLLGARLTLLYGASGVGKSSLLQAGVVHHLRRLMRENLEEHGAPEFVVATFSTWQGKPVRGLLEAVATAVHDTWESRRAFVEPVTEGPGLVEGLRTWTERLGGVILVLLDQFEEYFLYHPDPRHRGFDQELAAAVNAPDLQVHFLISLREDALARLDRFKGKIPVLFQNYLRLEHLDRKAAQAAIEEPLAEWSRRLGLAENGAYRAEPRLVEEVLDQLAVGKVTVGDGGGLVAAPSSRGGRIETPYLQLVLTRLWEEEVRLDSRVLRKATLVESLGGADTIVQTHLDGTLAALSQEEQETAAGILRYLVTPGGAKIALGPRDLAEYAKLPLDRVEPVLRRLSKPEVRVLRPVSDPDGTPLYEIFHDVLGEAVLDWRRRFEREREQSVTKQRFARLRTGVFWLGALLSLTILLAAGALHQRNRAEQQVRISTARGLAVQALSLADAQPDLRLLLSAQAQQIFDGFESRHALLSSLQGAPGLVGFLGRHEASILSTAYQPDGKTLVSGARDGTVRLWSIDDRSPLGPAFRIGTQSLQSLALSPDGKTLAAVAGEDGAVHLWSIEHRRPIGGPLRYPGGSAGNLQFSPDGRMLAIAGWDGGVQLWSLATRRLIEEPVQGIGPFAGPFSFSPDGRLFAAASVRGTVRLWDLASAQSLGEPLQIQGRQVTRLAFSPDSRVLAIGEPAGSVSFWSVLDQQLLGTSAESHQGGVTSLSFSPDNRMLASGGMDGKIVLSELAPKGDPWLYTSSRLLGGQGSPVRSLSFSRDGRTLTSGGFDGSVCLWSTSAPYPLSKSVLSMRGSRRPSLIPGIVSLSFSPDGRMLAATGGEALGVVRLWTVSTGREVGDLLQGLGEIRSLSFSPDGMLLAAGGEDGQVRLWSLAERHLVGQTPRVHDGWVWSVAFDPRGRMLASGGKDGKVHLWSVPKLAPLGHLLRSQEHEIRSLSFSADGQMLAAGGDDGVIRLWTVSDLRSLGEPLKGHRVGISNVSFSPDAKLLASSGLDGSVRLWSVENGQPLGQAFEGKGLSSTSISFSPDGKVLAAAGPYGWRLLWLPGLRPLGEPFEPRSAPGTNISFSPDGRSVATSGWNDVRLWDTDPISWRARACQMANRNLSLSEWQQYVGPEIPYQRTCPDLPPGDGAPADQ